MHQRHFTFLLKKGHLRDHVLERDQLTRQSTDRHAWLSELEKALCMVDELLGVFNAI
jgi:hypothetical protein